MENFISLPEEKKAAILDAGFLCFGKLGYKKSSVNDITSEAGISKAMLFHYFGNKKNFYLYLTEKSVEIMMDSIKAIYDPKLTDIFDIMFNITECKIDTLKKHPYLLGFFSSIFHETDPEVSEKVGEFLKKGTAFRTNDIFSKMDSSKFKDGVDPKTVLKLLTRYSEGFASGSQYIGNSDLDRLSDEFRECMMLLKQNLYKEEYL